jgi:hypothetical protein
MVFDEGKGLSTAAQQSDPTSIFDELRSSVSDGSSQGTIESNIRS